MSFIAGVQLKPILGGKWCNKEGKHHVFPFIMKS